MCVHPNSFMTSYVETQPPARNCCEKGTAQGTVVGAGWALRTGRAGMVENHLVLLMGAEVQQDVQVLELAGRALEDQVSEGGHAQVGATLARGRDRAQAACRSLGWLSCLAQSWTCPHTPSRGLSWVPLRPHAGPCPRHRLQCAGLQPLLDAGDRGNLRPCLPHPRSTCESPPGHSP